MSSFGRPKMAHCDKNRLSYGHLCSMRGDMIQVEPSKRIPLELVIEKLERIYPSNSSWTSIFKKILSVINFFNYDVVLRHSYICLFEIETFDSFIQINDLFALLNTLGWIIFLSIKAALALLFWIVDHDIIGKVGENGVNMDTGHIGQRP